MSTPFTWGDITFIDAEYTDGGVEYAERPLVFPGVDGVETIRLGFRAHNFSIAGFLVAASAVTLKTLRDVLRDANDGTVNLFSGGVMGIVHEAARFISYQVQPIIRGDGLYRINYTVRFRQIQKNT